MQCQPTASINLTRAEQTDAGVANRVSLALRTLAELTLDGESPLSLASFTPITNRDAEQLPLRLIA